MAARGRPPKPTAEKKRSGTLQRCRQKNEPTPDAEIPPFPSWATRSAAPYWKEIAKCLFDNGLLTRLDQVALALLCEALAEYCECRSIVEEAARTEESGVKFITFTDKGNIIQHPAVGVMNKAWGKVVKLLVQFGMTPSARAGLAIGNAKEKPDILAQLIAESTAPAN
jgi:P27 family predicted phage terminase small subunit